MCSEPGLRPDVSHFSWCVCVHMDVRRRIHQTGMSVCAASQVFSVGHHRPHCGVCRAVRCLGRAYIGLGRLASLLVVLHRTKKQKQELKADSTLTFAPTLKLLAPTLLFVPPKFNLIPQTSPRRLSKELSHERSDCQRCCRRKGTSE